LAAFGDKKTGANPALSTVLTSRSLDASVNAAVAMQSESIGVSALQNAFSEERAYSARMRILMTLEALQDLSKHLAGVPGRKNLLWFSSDFPAHLFPNPGEQGYFNYEMQADDSLVRRTADDLTAARIAIYPINAKGVMNDEVLNADSRGPENTSNSSHIGSADPTTDPAHPMNAYRAEARARAAEIQGMNQLASETGGKAIYNTNDLNTATQRAVSDGAHYYTLSYSPANKKMDGHYRSIEVRVAGSKYKLSYRYGYNADDESKIPAPTDSDPLRPMVRYGMPNATQILYGVRVVPVQPQPAPGATHAGKNANLTGPITRYDLDFMVRWQDVKLEATPQGRRRGTIQVALLAYDRDGKAVNWAGATQGMNLDPNVHAAIQKSGIPVHTEIDLPNTDVYLETGVYDWGSGKTGTLEIPLRVGSDTAGRPAAANTN
jgi:VWFA-related protein